MSHHLAVGEMELQLTHAHKRSVRFNDVRLSGVDCISVVLISVYLDIGNILSTFQRLQIEHLPMHGFGID